MPSYRWRQTLRGASCEDPEPLLRVTNGTEVCFLHMNYGSAEKKSEMNEKDEFFFACKLSKRVVLFACTLGAWTRPTL